MRLGVLDVGSNTVHLQVVDAHPGARPSPATNQKVELRLHEYLDISGEITAAGVELLETAIADAISHAKEFKTEEILAFATSAIRDDEARMTFLAVRRWLGWSSGRLLVLDIGGGSLEIAVGDDESAEATVSLPLGASRLTREYLSSDPHTSKEIKALESYVIESVKSSIPDDIMEHIADHFVATSKTFRTLARLGEHWFDDNPKYLKINSLTKMIPKLQEMSNKERAELPGVSQSRARQIVAGAIVARTTMERLHINELEICPWALREGIVLRWLDWMER
jgi:exopolyphosphatase/guanosine-5'-triphosphate,3'-diphosphate pyrophosphatase